MKKQDTGSPVASNVKSGGKKASDRTQLTAVPPIPLIGDNANHQVGRRDTLERVSCVIELLAEMDYGKGLSSKAETGLYWVHMMLVESLNYLSRALEAEKHPE